MIIGQAARKSATLLPGSIPGAKNAFAKDRRIRRSTTGAATRSAARLTSSNAASRTRSLSPR
jgi:hypothetical protein